MKKKRTRAIGGVVCWGKGIGEIKAEEIRDREICKTLRKRGVLQMNPISSVTQKGVRWALNTEKILALVEEKKDIRDVIGMFCDDITFCPITCEMISCPRNSKNIRDKTVPHSYSIEIPEDCPKKV